MFAGGLILAATCMGFAVWLQRTESMGWPRESYAADNERDQLYLRRRRRSRFWVNTLFFSCGVLILGATLATPAFRSVWVGCWLGVTTVLLVIVTLACFDVWRTLKYQRERLKDLRER